VDTPRQPIWEHDQHPDAVTDRVGPVDITRHGSQVTIVVHPEHPAPRAGLSAALIIVSGLAVATMAMIEPGMGVFTAVLLGPVFVTLWRRWQAPGGTVDVVDGWLLVCAARGADQRIPVDSLVAVRNSGTLLQVMTRPEGLDPAELNRPLTSADVGVHEFMPGLSFEALDVIAEAIREATGVPALPPGDTAPEIYRPQPDDQTPAFMLHQFPQEGLTQLELARRRRAEAESETDEPPRPASR